MAVKGRGRENRGSSRAALAGDAGGERLTGGEVRTLEKQEEEVGDLLVRSDGDEVGRRWLATARSGRRWRCVGGNTKESRRKPKKVHASLLGPR
jgi:hypothetical protein